MMTTGQASPTKHSHINGQAQQTLKKKLATKQHTSQTMKSNTRNRQEQQKDYHNRSSQQHKSEQSTNSHTFHTAAGAKHASAQKDEQTTIQDKQASNRSSKSTSPTSKQWKRKATLQFSQQLTWKQACAWQPLYKTELNTSSTWSTAYKHSSWKQAEHKQH